MHWSSNPWDVEHLHQERDEGSICGSGDRSHQQFRGPPFVESQGRVLEGALLKTSLAYGGDIIAHVGNDS